MSLVQKCFLPVVRDRAKLKIFAVVETRSVNSIQQTVGESLAVQSYNFTLYRNYYVRSYNVIIMLDNIDISGNAPVAVQPLKEGRE